jgi:DMSO/TMAO reductase YedYZ heme-binding membrane subunit
VRLELYSAAVIASLVVAALFVLLLAISSNRALGWLGQRRWKSLQRASYPAFALTVAHGFAFQLIEGRVPWLVAALALLVLAVLAAQLAGWQRVSLRGRRSPAQPGP